MDEQLALARAGNLGAFGTLVQAHKHTVYSLALRMLGQPELAEDMAQEVFMQLHANLRSIQSADHLAFWLRRVTAHRVIDYLRRRPAVSITSLDEEAEQIDSADPVDPMLQRQLRRLILGLSPDARAVVTLRYQEDLDPLDIARTLDMPINTVKSHLKRSLELMRQRIESGESPAARVNPHD
jgi:RNA polymerase sigma-70 factor (ECF subfamily)